MDATRRLSAVLVADIAGFSRLMRTDEDATFEAVRKLHHKTVPPVLKQHDGHLVKNTGDGFLATFESTVNAVRFGIALQGLLAEDELELRIRINVGDLLSLEGDVYGDAVNVAARLEAVCSPGGIAMSESVYEQVRDRLAISVQKMEPQKLKNIDRPVGVRLWRGHSQQHLKPEVFTQEDKPSIAVLAFANMSNDPEQEYFADGIAEDITTALSRIERFFVVSRTTSFSFKGQNLNLKDVGETLGVKYILEGSIRAAGGRLRVTAQLIEASSGQHIWAEKFDRNAEDVFEIQDEITRSIVSTIWWELTKTEKVFTTSLERTSLPVWRLVNLAWSEFYNLTPDGISKGLELAHQALELEETDGRAHQVAAMAHSHQTFFSNEFDVAEALSNSLKHANLAVKYASNDDWSYLARALTLNRLDRPDKALADLSRAIEINPNCSLAFGVRGGVLQRLGMPEEAIEAEMIAITTSPRSGDIFFRYEDLAACHIMLGDYEASMDWSRRALAHKPALLRANIYLIASLQGLGRKEQLPSAIESVLVEYGSVNEQDLQFFIPKHPEYRSKILSLLHEAGLLS